MRSLKLLALVFGFVLCGSVFADQIVLKNGDRLTGAITKFDGTSLTIKTEFTGDVTAQWSAVQEVTSTQPLHVVTQGKTVVGPVSTTDTNLVVATPNGAVNIAKADITALRSDSEQSAYEKALHPPLTQGWAGGANVGFAVTRGNSETKNLNLAFNADRKTGKDDISLYANSVYATNDAPKAVPSVSANTIQAGARYSRNFSKRLFAFGSGDFQTDALQELNLRSVLGGGIGFHLINTPKTTLDLLAGVVYTRENYTTFNRNFAALDLGEELSRKLGASTLLTEKLYFFPDMNDTSQYRGTFNFGTVTKLSKWLGWQNAFGDIYVTNPPVGAKKNDLVITTGLNVSFMH
jgi:putative salt-induced outer membrane protein YdiY